MHLSGRTLFISDLHLDESRPEMAAAFEGFLSKEARSADALYILGDLFEFWAGDDSLALPFQARMADALRDTAARIPTAFMHGNRDFLVNGPFSRETGVRMLDDPSQVDLYGTRAVLLHGDTLCTDDTEYQAFRAKVRDREWQRATLSRPLAERVALAKSYREGSEAAKRGKSMEIMDVAPAAVEKAFADSGCDLMIHGHTHRPARHVHRVGGRECIRWVLSDWYDRGSYLEATPSGLRAVTL
ncbi:UDP-2,3-diacylglucosamine diphosphatase [Usitatibacter palustris]|uniref:UDP-2,3-diacylglucosamine hydrolase n=1 Tax=Usitatibacter palustris TaxID=2732487 RepID=A0A6M4H6X1_9PROT|nr:UDP-2,3-diacylglucosamine diphosphatase [Usitatibacter palustris]QJR14688.1 UDP-2,3-diacylglucosamine hydrolase [Usitatibacter palustris]